MTETTTGLELRSEVTPEGKLRLTLEEVAVPTPGPDEVVVRIEAAPINPSDLRLLIGPADGAMIPCAPAREPANARISSIDDHGTPLFRIVIPRNARSIPGQTCR